MRDRLSPFYVLESNAKGSSTAHIPFLKFEGKVYTYAQTYDIVLRYGAWLRQAHGVKPQDIVAMDFENSDIFVFLWMGIWSIGAKPAFMNYNLSGPTLTHCVKTSNASLLLVDPNVASNVTDDVRKDLSHVRIVELNPGLEREILSTEPQRRPDSERTEEFGHGLAILIYTSGTTGMPKPAIVSWSKCISGAGFVSRWLGWRPGDVFYTVSLHKTSPLRLHSPLENLPFASVLLPPFSALFYLPCSWLDPIIPCLLALASLLLTNRVSTGDASIPQLSRHSGSPKHS